MGDTRKCSKCGEVKPLESFDYRDKKLQKRAASCKQCRRERRNKRHHTPEGKRKACAHSRKYIEAHKEEVTARGRAYRKANRERIAARAKAYTEAHKESLRAKAKAWKAANPEHSMWRSIKQRARREGIPFDIEISDIEIPERCPVLKIPIFHGEGYACDNSPSLDRIIGEKGYTKGNVLVVSYRANRIKNSATVDDLQAIVKFYKPLFAKAQNP